MTDRAKIAWGITGAGDYLVESIEVMRRLREALDVEITVVLSKDGELVVKWYKLWDDLKAASDHVRSERGPNVPFLAGPLQIGQYAFLFVSPASGNTCAKIAYGIADSLITNCVAQTMKGGTPVYIYPVDQRPGSLVTQGPNGEQITITTRRIDLENVQRLRNMEGLTVLSDPAEILAPARDVLQ
ncbi:MAG: archaeoflavoprotein AfpA [Chloroflexota bacterium]|nr:archaeoflavoprotein AfpA [Chloroflexota bacterium]